MISVTDDPGLPTNDEELVNKEKTYCLPVH